MNPSAHPHGVTVTVERGAHTAPIPRGLERLVAQELALRGISGDFVLRLGPPVRSTSHTGRFQVLRLADRNTVEIYAQPGNNDTGRLGYLVMRGPIINSAGHSVSLADLMVALGAKNGHPKRPHVEFTRGEQNVTQALRVLRAIIGDEPARAATAKYALGEVWPELTTHGWGRVLGTLERRGLLVTTRDAGNRILTVQLTERGQARAPWPRAVLPAPSPRGAPAAAAGAALEQRSAASPQRHPRASPGRP